MCCVFVFSFSITLDVQTAVPVWRCGGGLALDFYVNVALYICILLKERRSELEVWLPRESVSNDIEFDS